jgi:hypothetical protein
VGERKQSFLLSESGFTGFEDEQDEKNRNRK